MERLAVLIILVLGLARTSHGQISACNPNPCRDSANCFVRNSQEGYVCECNMPNQGGFDCTNQTQNQAVFTCYGSQCSTGSFMSVNYPSNYPDRYRALYLLYVPGASGFNFIFDTIFRIEADKDELYIGSGLVPPFSQFNGVNTSVEGVFFFEGHTPPMPFSVVNTDTVWMYFITDKNINFPGFRVSWQTVDTEAPVVSGCPGDFTRVTTVNQPLRVSWDPITATDASDFTVSASHSSGNFFPVGPTRVTFTFVDTGGLTTICSFVITVVLQDTSPPVISGCPTNMIRTTTNPLGVTVSWIPPTARDENTFTTQSTHTPGQLFPVATTEVRYTFTDVNGFFSVCTFSITVQLINRPPVISGCPSDRTLITNTFQGSAATTWVEPTATDDGPITVTRTHTPGQNFPVGRTEVIYTFTDSNNLASMCSFVVVVTFVDVTPPVVTGCPNSITETAPFGAGVDFPVTWIEPTANDNTGTVMLILRSRQPGDRFPIGQTTSVLYLYADNAGLQASCQFDVTVVRQEDNVPPVISCPANIRQEVTSGNAPGAIITWQAATATDNFGVVNVTLTSNPPRFPNTFFPFGIYLVTYTAIDAALNSVSCTFTVTVGKVSFTKF
ncbi:hyalin-like [Acanthaster planci]|uniref:Hyalin-like n=1 Tax=Acanthaster planci TaxID=133434 RepID=A0A8B7ZYK0_ACAPL|nr:hyalin-like [Acanthaster planci]